MNSTLTSLLYPSFLHHLYYIILPTSTSSLPSGSSAPAPKSSSSSRSSSSSSSSPATPVFQLSVVRTQLFSVQSISSQFPISLHQDFQTLTYQPLSPDLTDLVMAPPRASDLKNLHAWTTDYRRPDGAIGALVFYDKPEEFDTRGNIINEPPELEDLSDFWVAWAIGTFKNASTRADMWPTVFTMKGMTSGYKSKGRAAKALSLSSPTLHYEIAFGNRELARWEGSHRKPLGDLQASSSTTLTLGRPAVAQTQEYPLVSPLLDIVKASKIQKIAEDLARRDIPDVPPSPPHKKRKLGKTSRPAGTPMKPTHGVQLLSSYHAATPASAQTTPAPPPSSGSNFPFAPTQTTLPPASTQTTLVPPPPSRTTTSRWVSEVPKDSPPPQDTAQATEQLKKKIFSCMTTAASLSDLAHSYENMVGLMYSTIKSAARDNRSSYAGEMSILKDKIKIE